MSKKQSDQDLDDPEADLEAADDNTVNTVTEEDSDLASLAREFAKEEIQDSPFLKRSDRRKSSTLSVSGTPLPEDDIPFITSLTKSSPQKHLKAQTSNVLEQFMKFEKSYGAKKNFNDNKYSIF